MPDKLSMYEIYAEDCVTTMARMPDACIDLVITSPPYDNLRRYSGDYSVDIDTISAALFRVMKPGGVIVYVIGDATINGSETGTSFRHALRFKEVGFNLHDTMIYAKTNPIPLTHNRYEQQFEYMFVFSKGKPKTFHPLLEKTKGAGKTTNHKSEKHYEQTHSMRRRDQDIATKDTRYMYNIWWFTTGTGDKVKHNAPFPEQLVLNHLLSWSNEGDMVYDPFLGSGTTAKVAVLNNRYCIGSEISADYCAEADARIRRACEEEVSSAH